MLAIYFLFRLEPITYRWHIWCCPTLTMLIIGTSRLNSRPVSLALHMRTNQKQLILIAELCSRSGINSHYSLITGSEITFLLTEALRQFLGLGGMDFLLGIRWVRPVSAQNGWPTLKNCWWGIDYVCRLCTLLLYATGKNRDALNTNWDSKQNAALLEPWLLLAAISSIISPRVWPRSPENISLQSHW